MFVAALAVHPRKRKREDAAVLAAVLKHIEAELAAYAGEADDAPEDGGPGEDDSVHDSDIDEGEIRKAVTIMCGGDGTSDPTVGYGADDDVVVDPALGDIEIEVETVLQSVVAHDAAPHIDAVAPEPTEALQSGINTWAFEFHRVVLAAAAVSCRPQVAKARNLSYVAESNGDTVACRWIFWDVCSDGTYNGRYTRVDGNRVVFQPKGRRLRDCYFHYVHDLSSAVTTARIVISIPDTGCGMLRTADRMMQSQMSNDVLVLANVLSRSLDTSSIEHLSSGTCNVCKCVAATAVMFCPICGLEYNDACSRGEMVIKTSGTLVVNYEPV